MEQERIGSLISPEAFEEMHDAVSLMEELNENPVARLNSLCGSIAMLMGHADVAGTMHDRETRQAYSEFARLAIAKAKELL